MWGEIKKAINSTVGTADFKPLDEIVKESAVKPIIAVYTIIDAKITVTTSKSSKTVELADSAYATPTYIEVDTLGEVQVTGTANSGYLTIDVSREINSVGIYKLIIRINTAGWADMPYAEQRYNVSSQPITHVFSYQGADWQKFILEYNFSSATSIYATTSSNGSPVASFVNVTSGVAVLTCTPLHMYDGTVKYLISDGTTTKISDTRLYKVYTPFSVTGSLDTYVQE